MVVSVNSETSKNEFATLLNSTLSALNEDARKVPEKIERLKGSKLEPYIGEVMSELAIGTAFEDSIEVIGGQKFPDIIAKRFFGIEVKSTIKDHWRSTGNSVLESTRIEDVERIFMLFGKLVRPIEFKCKPYEECLSEVVVTHSPRYLIDMNLEAGNTIFDKINTSYDNLRSKENPIEPITEYYKSKLKPGQNLWWIQDTEHPSSLVINIWNNLNRYEKIEMRTKAMVYFPEIFSNKSDKFARVAVWLVTQEAIVCPNLRDIFTAGGKEDYVINNKTYKGIPQIFIKLIKNIDVVLKMLYDVPATQLHGYWDQEVSEVNKIDFWINEVSNHSRTVRDASHLNVKQILTELLQ